MFIPFKKRTLDLSTPQIMGILNVTPDSFSDGGRFTLLDEALRQAEKMLAEGAAIIDVGGESTRPGAESVGVQEELDRVLPVIERLHAELDVLISIDTSKAQVMREAVAAGADMINDVLALQAENAIQTASELSVPVCLMHMQGKPRSMQSAPSYNNVVAEVSEFLQQRLAACLTAGIPAQNLILDPGFGFGKSVQHNMQLIKGLPELVGIGRPVLLGVSRKSTIGAILDRPVDQRLYGSLALATLALTDGVSLLRVHDVAATRDIIRMFQAVKEA